MLLIEVVFLKWLYNFRVLMSKAIVLFIKRRVGLINAFLNRFNHFIIRIDNNSKPSADKIMINVGSGDWYYKGWINLDYPSEWYRKAQKGKKFIPYDMRKDVLPFEDNTVDVIYCSHVIEHIEDEYVQKVFDEWHRVLKKDGTVRIACPDAEFLYQISKRKTQYYNWLHQKHDTSYVLDDVDCLVRELATPRLGTMLKAEYDKAFEEKDMNEFLQYITNGLKYNQNRPGDHINCFTYEKIRKMLCQAGFDFVIRSKYMGSCSNEMNNKIHKFDLTYPCMSLYVEAIK